MPKLLGAVLPPATRHAVGPHTGAPRPLPRTRIRARVGAATWRTHLPRQARGGQSLPAHPAERLHRPQVFTASMAAALEWGDVDYALGAFDNFCTHYLRRGGSLLAYRGLEMAQQGRMLTVAAKLWWFSG